MTYAIGIDVGGSADVVSGSYEHTINMQSRMQHFRAFVLSGADTYVTMGGLTRVALVDGSLMLEGRLTRTLSFAGAGVVGQSTQVFSEESLEVGEPDAHRHGSTRPGFRPQPGRNPVRKMTQRGSEDSLFRRLLAKCRLSPG